MLTELGHRCSFDCREHAFGGSAEGRLLVTWMGATSSHHCSHLLPSWPAWAQETGSWSVPPQHFPNATQLGPCQQQLLHHSVLEHPVPSPVGGYCFICCCSRILLPYCPCYCSVSVVINTILLPISFTAGVWQCRKGTRHGWRSAGPQRWCGVRHCSQDFKAHGLEGDKSKGKYTIDRMAYGLLRCCLETFSLLTGVLMLPPAVLKAWFVPVCTMSFK